MTQQPSSIAGSIGGTTDGVEARKTAEMFRVGGMSNPNKVAGAIAGVINQNRVVVLQTMGAGALNQAVKAIAIARGFLEPLGIDLIGWPAFADVVIDGEERTALRLTVEPR